MWKILLIFGIILVILYFNREKFLKETMVDNEKYYNMIYNRAKELPKYPVDIDIREYKNNLNIKTNRILTEVLDLANKNTSYPVIFNPSLKPVEKMDITDKSEQVYSLVKYLEQIFNSFDGSWQLTNMNIKKVIKHLTEQQLKYDILLSTDIKIMENKKIYTERRDIYMEVIISKFTSGEIKPSYDIYFKSLILANMDHLQYLSGLEKQINLEQIKPKKDEILEDKKKENQLEVNERTNNFDPKYPEYSIYETFIPANSLDKYSDCSAGIVNTEDILDIFQ